MAYIETSTVLDSVTARVRTVRKQAVVSMLDIKDTLIKLAITDTILKALLGATAANPRIYPYYQGGAIIDDAHRAYVTIAHLALPEMTQAVGEPVFSLAIWGQDLDAVEPVRDRLVVLLNEVPVTTVSGRALWGTLVGDRDSYQENTKFTGRTLQFEFGFSKV